MIHSLSCWKEIKTVVNGYQSEKSLAHLPFSYCLQDLALFAEFHHLLPFKEKVYLIRLQLKFLLIYQKASFNLYQMFELGQPQKLQLLFVTKSKEKYKNCHSHCTKMSRFFLL